MMSWNAEFLKCKKDLIYFIENYCVINSKKITLTEVQKNFLRKYNNVRKDDSN